jgi:hypothetical protein
MGGIINGRENRGGGHPEDVGMHLVIPRVERPSNGQRDRSGMRSGSRPSIRGSAEVLDSMRAIGPRALT